MWWISPVLRAGPVTICRRTTASNAATVTTQPASIPGRPSSNQRSVSREWLQVFLQERSVGQSYSTPQEAALLLARAAIDLKKLGFSVSYQEMVDAASSLNGTALRTVDSSDQRAGIEGSPVLKELKRAIEEASSVAPVVDETGSGKTRKPMSRIAHQKYLNALQRRRSSKNFATVETFPEMCAEFSTSSKIRTILEDLQKALIHQDVVEAIRSRFPKDNLRFDSFSEVLTRTFRTELERINRPVLVHDTGQYVLPYLTRISTLETALLNLCCQTANDERAMESLILKDPVLSRLRCQADSVPELLEPLVAFHGSTLFSTDPSVRLVHMLEGINIFLNALPNTRVIGRRHLQYIFSSLPENTDSSRLNPNHPFRNNLGFRSAAPTGVSGSIRLGQPAGASQEQLNACRYPTLQSVAHGLPQDPAYRETVVNAITVLERQPGWEHHEKVKFINNLKQVYSTMAPNQYYSTVLNLALPKDKKRYMINVSRRRKSRGIFSAHKFLLPVRPLKDKIVAAGKHIGANKRNKSAVKKSPQQHLQGQVKRRA